MLFSTGGAYTGGTGTFSPSVLTVTRGATVSFTNNSGVTHNVIFDTQGVAGGDIGVIGSGSQQRTFANTGTFAFHCAVHEGMTGTISVQ
jgi:plastocyanin